MSKLGYNNSAEALLVLSSMWKSHHVVNWYILLLLQYGGIIRTCWSSVYWTFSSFSKAVARSFFHLLFMHLILSHVVFFEYYLCHNVLMEINHFSQYWLRCQVAKIILNSSIFLYSTCNTHHLMLFTSLTTTISILLSISLMKVLKTCPNVLVFTEPSLAIFFLFARNH